MNFSPIAVGRRAYCSQVERCWFLIGFLHGSYYAGAHLFRYEAKESELLSTMTTNGGGKRFTAAALQAAVAEYGQLQGAKA